MEPKCALCLETLYSELPQVTVTCPREYPGRSEEVHPWCLAKAYKSVTHETRHIFRDIDARRKAKEDPCIGENCARCGEQIKTSEQWSYRSLYQGAPNKPSCHRVGKFYFHEPKCPEE